MGKSRTASVLFVTVTLVLGFVVVVALLSAVMDTDNGDSGLTEWFEFDNRIGIVPIEGTITQSQTTLKLLRKYRKRSSIKAIILKIDSPGGAVAPAQEVYREIERTKRKKPVVASIGTVGASAAYLISSNTNRIVCSEGSITGSIGVIMMLPDLQKLVEKLGVGINIIKAGKYKDMGSAVRPLTKEERDFLEGFAKGIHEQFIDAVAKGRKGKISREKLVSIADGRFFSGKQAKALGLVDTIGNFYDAVKVAKKLSGIRGKAKLVYPEKEWEGYLDLIFGSLAKALAREFQDIQLHRVVPTVR